MNEKRKLILSITLGVVGVLAVFGAIVGLTYAYFTANVGGNQNASSIEVNTARLATVQFTDSAQINADNMLPGTSTVKTFSVAMNGENTLDMSYKVFMYWKNSGITDMVYTLTGGGTPASIKAINTVQEEYKKDEIAEGTFSANTAATHNYTLTITFPETGVNQNSQQGKAFSAYLQVEFAVGGTRVCYNNENSDGYDCTPPVQTAWANSCPADSNSLNCNILKNNPEYLTNIVQNDLMFNNIAVSQEEYDNLPAEKDVYDGWIYASGQDMAVVDDELWTESRPGKTEDNLPVYFFRGATQNNYVSFANKMWRIVRINEDGSVKLILGGNSATDGYGGTTTAFNSNNDSALYVDYDNVSNILKTVNNTWYTNNLTAYVSYIADTKFCNDKSISFTETHFDYFGASTRLDNYVYDLSAVNTPQFKCPNSSDNLLYKVGALTADEVAYAGAISSFNGIGNISFYLYDNAQDINPKGRWWLMTPKSESNTEGVLYYIDNDGVLTYQGNNYVVGFRPVVSLKSDTLILRGDGRHDSPYVITE